MTSDDIGIKTIKTILNELIKILNEKDEKLKIEFEVIKENVIDRLQRMLDEESDNEVKTTINETIKKVESENFDKINYIFSTFISRIK